MHKNILKTAGNYNKPATIVIDDQQDAEITINPLQ